MRTNANHYLPKEDKLKSKLIVYLTKKLQVMKIYQDSEKDGNFNKIKIEKDNFIEVRDIMIKARAVKEMIVNAKEK